MRRGGKKYSDPVIAEGPMMGENANLFSRSDLEAILFADNSGVRAQFRRHFAEVIQQFLEETERVYGRVIRFGRGLRPDLRAAWTEAFVSSGIPGTPYLMRIVTPIVLSVSVRFSFC